MAGWDYKNHAIPVLETPGNMSGDSPSSYGIEALQQFWAAGVDMAHFAMDEGDSAHGHSHPMQMKGKAQAGDSSGIESLSMVLKHYGY